MSRVTHASQSRDQSAYSGLQATLPNYQHAPPVAAKFGDGASITRDIAFYLRDPVRQIRSRPSGLAANMTVPETAVDENGNSISRKDYVRPSWQISAIDSEPEADAMHGSSDVHLWLGVRASNRRHVSAALRARHMDRSTLIPPATTRPLPAARPAPHPHRPPAPPPRRAAHAPRRCPPPRPSRTRAGSLSSHDARDDRR